jgi:hypothetical protein
MYSRWKEAKSLNASYRLSRSNSLRLYYASIRPRLPYFTFEALERGGFTLNESENGQGLVSFGSKWYSHFQEGGSLIQISKKAPPSLLKE